MSNIYEEHLAQNRANFEPLTPISFLLRSGTVYADKIAVVHGDERVTYAQLLQRCRRLASALVARGVAPGDTVAVIAANTPAHLEAHFGIPMTGAVLNSINTRLDSATIGFIVDHGEASVFLVDTEFADAVRDALKNSERQPLVIDIHDALGPEHTGVGTLTYEALLGEGDPDYQHPPIDDEWQAISLNYTSGTTGNPKGVVYHHRGAYLNAMANSVVWNLPKHPSYLWTLPMFHCNGWCFPWTATALGATHVCLRKVETGPIIDLIETHNVTHFCGAPIVLGLLLNAPDELKSRIPRGLKALTAGAAPPAAILAGLDDMGVEVTHVYGLTEVYGPAVVCDWNSDWNALPAAERAALKSRQGVTYHSLEGLEVMDPATMLPVPADGESMGEIMFRGNVVMKGYLKNPAATDEALAQGWFHSGDLAVRHPDGYLEIRDRSKDIIISGGENISSIEVEGALYQHADVLAAAVVAIADEKWGEVPCAFVELKSGAVEDASGLIQHCRDHLAGFKIPKRIVFGDLPKTSTGKIQKFVLRQRVTN